MFSANLGSFVSLYVRSLSVELTDAVIFTTLELANFIKLYNMFLVLGFGVVIEFNIIFERFCTVYNMKNLQMIELPKDEPKLSNEIVLVYDDSEEIEKGEVKFTNFSGYWKEDSRKPDIEDINLKIEKNKFYGLCGVVGSGKSTLLQTIIKELPYYQGKVEVNGKVSYFEQEAVIFSQSIKDNILFGRDFDQSRYNKVVKASCLLPDFELFDNGENTLVGEKGITLSGGQKARVSLARMLYSEADIYILDDPLSAVDAKVARNLFDNVFMNLIRGKTIILSTHQIHFLDQCDYIIALEGGRIEAFGEPRNLNHILEHIIEEEK